jgi:hypothetical protein
VTSTVTTDRFDPARSVADAVMREGQILYPYRASSRKNQHRWQFGVLAPQHYVETNSAESSSMRAECLVESGRQPAEIALRLRCVRLESRRVEEVVETTDPGGSSLIWRPVPSLEVAGELLTTWDESIETEISVGPVVAVPEATSRTDFSFESSLQTEQLVDVNGTTVGRVVRRCQDIAGEVLVSFKDEGFGLTRVCVEVRNTTAWAGPAADRSDLVGHCLLACHLVLAADGGRFISMLDPPERARAAVGACTQRGCFPVLIGSSSKGDLVLASPIILYDHPEIAPESPGEMCDATEIDEILALRTLTLTEDEKRQARATDERAAAIIDLVDDMPPEVFERLHGAVRSMAAIGGSSAPKDDIPTYGAGLVREAPWWDPGADASVDPQSDTVTVGGHGVQAGTAVLLRPGHGADAQDMFLEGRRGTVTGVFHDVDGEVHVAVTVDDDPAADMHAWQGRFRYFHPWELEVVGR